MVLSDEEAEQLAALNNHFVAACRGSLEDIPVYSCNPATTAETAHLLARAGFTVYCPYFTGKIRKHRRSKVKTDAAILYFSGYIFVQGASPKELFPDRVTRLRFGDMFGKISVEELLTY